MDEVTKDQRDTTHRDESKDEAPPTAPRPGDENAYADSWYQVLKGWEKPPSDADAAN